MKRFIKTVVLLLASPFVLLMLGLVLAIVRFGDFLTDDDCQKPNGIWGVWRTPATAEPG